MREFDWFNPIRALRGKSRRRTSSKRSALRRQAASRRRLLFAESLEPRILLTIDEPAWVELGPGPIENKNDPKNFAGAVGTFAVIGPIGEEVLFAGSVAGGLWRATSLSEPNWIPLSDLAGPSYISALTVDPRDNNTLYVGTGSYSNAQGENVFQQAAVGLF